MKTAIVVAGIIIILLVVFTGGRMFLPRDTAATLVFSGKLPGKAAVVYFSQSKVRNTALVAAWIQKHTGGELIEIVPKTPYPEAYGETLREVRRERQSGGGREILPVKVPEDCEVVFVGSPVWYGTFAPPLAAFLKENRLAGRTVVPFCTHGGGGAGHFEEDLRNACPEARVLPVFSARGSNQIERRLGSGVSAHHTEDDVIVWLNRLFGEGGGAGK